MKVFPSKGKPQDAKPESVAEMRAMIVGLGHLVLDLDRGLPDAVERMEGLLALVREGNEGHAAVVMAELWLEDWKGFMTNAVHAEG
jgi:hypothetical protein